MEDQAILTLNVTVTLKPEPGIDAATKEATIKQNQLDQMAANAAWYDWGVAVNGTLESTLSDTVTIDDTKPDYEEQ